MRLFICEKPSQGADYAKALNVKGGRKDGYIECGNDTYITWCFGHLLDTLQPEDYGEEYKKWGLTALPIFPRDKWNYVVGQGKSKQYKTIKGLVDKADEVYISSDADREGELIVVSLLERMKYTGKRMRVWTGALDEESIRAAIKSARPAEITFPYFKAAKTRQQADWIHGMNLTRAMTVVNRPYIEGIFSLGRVQTAVLNIIVKRDLEIENFKPKDYYDMSCVFKTLSGEELKTTWDMPKELKDEIEDKCLDKEKVKAIVDKVKGKTGDVTVSEKSRKKEDHPLLFSLDTLQKECSKLYGYTAAQVLETAQSLYETHKATTYPRTDCEYINEEQMSRIGKTFQSMGASDSKNSEINDFISRADLKMKSRVWNTKKVTAHHAIVPNIAQFDISKLNDRELKVYDLIRRRYIAQFFPKAEVDSTKIEIMCEGERFKASGTMPVSAGWKEVLGKKAETKELPVVDKGDKLPDAKPKLESKKTKPPARYSDGSLIDAMKNAAKFVEDSAFKKMLKGTEGIGTVATRGEIIKTLHARNYVKADKKNLISTDKGRALIECAPSGAKSIEMTAYWESQLEMIASGNLEPQEFLDKQEELLTVMIEDIRSGKCTLKKAVGALYTCPKCDGGLRKTKKSEKTGKCYWICINKDNCGAIYQDNRGKPLFPKEVDQGDVEHTCEVCKKSKLTRKISKKNKFYWQCDDRECGQFYIDQDMKPIIYKPEVIDQGTEKHSCFSCGKADLVRKKGQYGMYWNCPSCRKNFKEGEDKKPLKPEEKPKSDYKCPNCKDGYLVKRPGKKGDFFGCNNFPKCKTIKNSKDGKPEGF